MKGDYSDLYIFKSFINKRKKLIYKFKEEINYKIKKSSKIEEYNIEEGFIIKKEIINEFEKNI